jgi:hypothetical protein
VAGTRRTDKIMNPSDLPWWAWILLAALLWFLQLVVSSGSDKSIPANKHATIWWTVRALMIVGMFLCAMIGTIQFAKWAWHS